MPPRHEVLIVREDPIVRLVLSGEIDIAAAAEIARRVDEIVHERTSLVVDLSETTFLDSAGIGGLVVLSNAAHDASAAVTMVPGPVNVMHVLEMVGLAEMFGVTPDYPDPNGTPTSPGQMRERTTRD